MGVIEPWTLADSVPLGKAGSRCVFEPWAFVSEGVDGMGVGAAEESKPGGTADEDREFMARAAKEAAVAPLCADVKADVKGEVDDCAIVV